MAATYVLNTTTLSRAITAQETIIPVASVANITVGMWLASVNEAMMVMQIDGSALPNPKITVQRGVGGSRACDQATATTFYIGLPDKFYQSDPVGVPASPALVSPWINTSLADGGISFWTVSGSAWVQTVTLTAPTISSPTISSPAISDAVLTGNGIGGVVVSKTVAFVENATMTTSTGTVVIPAGATLQDIVVTSSALWSKASSRFICGDGDDADGWFTSLDLSGTDLLVGERLAAGTGDWGGKNGVYLVAATGRFGQATATIAGPYYGVAGSVIGVCTVTPGAGAAGRTFMTVTYSVGQSMAPVLA